MTWWAFDIEVEDWDKLVVACAVSEDGRELIMKTSAQVRAWYCSLAPLDIVWAHNGGGFDYLYLISVCPYPRFDWTARMAGSAIVSCRAKGYAECRDTTRLFQATLAEWTERKEQLELPCRCGQDCGGYCSIRRGMPESELRKVIDYCLADCRALLSRLREDLSRLESEGLSVFDHRGLPRLTFGSIAWHTASKLTGLAELVDPIEWAEYDAGRRGYYGGRCEVGIVRAILAHRFDVNAMYPWALTFPIPFGERRSLMRGGATRAFNAGRPGIYTARVFIPETDLPPLPHRYVGKRDGRLTPDRLLWSTGHIRGSWTHLELTEALKHGARIERIESADTWSQFEAIFRPYVEMIYAARARAIAAGDKRWGKILKWFANALTGKLAQQPEAATLRVTKDPNPEGDRAEWEWLGGDVWARVSRRLGPCSRPVAAAYLTSRSRIRLNDRLARHPSRWCYCDTDSTYLLDFDPADVHESKLGMFKYEGEARDWLALAPKLYRFKCAGPPFCKEDGHDHGGAHVRAKGVPDPEWDTLDALARGDIIYRAKGVERIKTSGGRFRKRAIKRSFHDAGGDRVGTRFILPDGTTRPIHRTVEGTYC